MTKSVSEHDERQSSNFEEGEWLHEIPDAWERSGGIHITYYDDHRKWFQTPHGNVVEISIDPYPQPDALLFRVSEIGDSVEIEIDEGRYNEDYERMLRVLLDNWNEFSSDVVQTQKEGAEIYFYENEKRVNRDCE